MKSTLQSRFQGLFYDLLSRVDMQIVQLPLPRVCGGGHNAEHILHTICHNKSGNASCFIFSSVVTLLCAGNNFKTSLLGLFIPLAVGIMAGWLKVLCSPVGKGNTGH